MPNDFPYDAFLSHSANNRAVMRPLAERLRTGGLKMGIDEWEWPSPAGAGAGGAAAAQAETVAWQ